MNHGSYLKWEASAVDILGSSPFSLEIFFSYLKLLLRNCNLYGAHCVPMHYFTLYSNLHVFSDNYA